MRRALFILVFVLLAAVLVPMTAGYMGARTNAPDVSSRDALVYKALLQSFTSMNEDGVETGVAAGVSIQVVEDKAWSVFDRVQEVYFRLRWREPYPHWRFWSFTGAQYAGEACLRSTDLPDEVQLFETDQCAGDMTPPWKSETGIWHGCEGPEVISLSRVGYDALRKKAEVLIWAARGPLCGGQFVAELSLRDGKWIVDDIFSTGLVS